jgi:tripartite-type tricarboxylate transporter receptor subunit TctC
MASNAKILAAALVLGATVGLPAMAADQAQYFTGKTINVIVGSTPGGAADFAARMFVKTAPKYFPGKPNFVVQNIPGGGQLRGLQTGMTSKPDGLTVALVHSRWAVGSILGEDLGPFNVRTARIIGAPYAAERNEMICADSKVYKSWKDVVAKGPLTLGNSQTGARNSLGAVLVEMLGAPIKNIYGYAGTTEITAAFDRGELTGVSCPESTVPRLFPEWLTQKKLTPLFWWGAPVTDAYLKQMGSPEKPVNVVDLPGFNFTEDGKNALLVAQKINLYTTAFALPPKTPDDLFVTWKDAFEKVMQDPETLAYANAGGLEVGLGRAEGFAESLDVAGKLSKQGLEIFKKLMGSES